MSSPGHDVSEKIIDGLTNYVVAVQDQDAGKFGAELYREVARELAGIVRPADTCKLAFPTVLVSAEKLPACLFVVLDDRIALAWQRGMFRSKTGVFVIPFDTITSIRRQAGTTAGTRDAVVLVISGSPAATIALPVVKTDIAEAVIRAAVTAGTR